MVHGLKDPVALGVFQDLLSGFDIEIVPVTEQQAYLSREAYLRFGRGFNPAAALNFGDCFAYSLARMTGEPLLFVGNDFSQTDIGIA